MLGGDVLLKGELRDGGFLFYLLLLEVVLMKEGGFRLGWKSRVWQFKLFQLGHAGFICFFFRGKD